MNYKKYLPLLLGTTLSLSLFTSGCSSQQAKTKAQQKNTSITNASTVSANKLSAEELFTNRDKEIGFEESNCTRISLADKKSSCSSSNVSIQEDIITISSEGSYLLSGTLSNGQICINAPEDAKVQLILDDVSISNTNSAAIYVKAADKVFLTLAEDSQNTLRTTDAFVADGEVNVDGVIFATSDLTLNGNGALSITSNQGHGIVSKDDLCFTSGSYTVDAAQHALSGKDSVRIAEGEFHLSAGTDGIHSEHTEDSSKGYIFVSNGTFSIDSSKDGFDASGLLQIENGSFSIVSNDGKGLKSDTSLLLSGGIINITNSYEGLEAQNILIEDGTISIVSTDDGINASSSNTQSSSDNLSNTKNAMEKLPDMPTENGTLPSNDQEFLKKKGGAGGFEVEENTSITINGGTLSINAQGDGIDSNGTLTINGGTTYIDGPSNSGNGALDSNGSPTIHGGTFVAVGCSQMAMNFGSDSTQCSIMSNLGSTQQNCTVSLTDSAGKEIVLFDAKKSFDNVLISSPSIQEGEQYTLSAGTASVSVTMDEKIYGESNGMGGGHRDETFDPSQRPNRQPANEDGSAPSDFPKKRPSKDFSPSSPKNESGTAPELPPSTVSQDTAQSC